MKPAVQLETALAALLYNTEERKQMNTLFLVRGLPGSGKSTLAQRLCPDRYAEADMFFMKDGEYKFDPIHIGAAHINCQHKVAALMREGPEDIAVSNTFSQQWEMEPYFELADKHGFTVFVIHCQNQYGSVHNPPEAVVQRMKERWEEAQT